MCLYRARKRSIAQFYYGQIQHILLKNTNFQLIYVFLAKIPYFTIILHYSLYLLYIRYLYSKVHCPLYVKNGLKIALFFTPFLGLFFRPKNRSKIALFLPPFFRPFFQAQKQAKNSPIFTPFLGPLFQALFWTPKRAPKGGSPKPGFFFGKNPKKSGFWPKSTERLGENDPLFLRSLYGFLEDFAKILPISRYFFFVYNSPTTEPDFPEMARYT